MLGTVCKPNTLTLPSPAEQPYLVNISVLQLKHLPLTLLNAPAQSTVHSVLDPL